MIYLDNAATTKVNGEVAMEILNTMAEIYGNPSSIYVIGRRAKRCIENAANAFKQVIGASDDDKVIFTGCGSEANTLALTGFRKWCDRNRYSCKIFTDAIEHKSILNQDYISPIIRVNDVGSVFWDDIMFAIQYAGRTTRYVLLSIQYANNEIGTIQDIRTISELVHQLPNVYLHVDAVQYFGECPIDVNDLGIDMMTVSFHKVGAPKGIGALYVRDGIELEPIIAGGEQMYGLRGGTENVPYIAGVKVICDNMLSTGYPERTKEYHKKIALRNRLASELLKIPDSRLNGPGMDSDYRLSNNISISYKDVDAQSLIALLDKKEIYVSAGSACNSHSNEASHVLRAINVPDEYIWGTIRLTIGDDLSDDDIPTVAEAVREGVEQLRRLTEMKENGSI